MTTFDLTPCHPILLALHVLATDDGFQLTMAAGHETTYTRSHAGWTTRVRALVLVLEPECTCTFDSYGCEGCAVGATEHIRLEVETELDGLGMGLSGVVAADISDAVWRYVDNVRSVARTFPLRLLRTRPNEIDTLSGKWPETPFHSRHVLAYAANIHWQLGDLRRAADSYTRLLEYKPVKVLWEAEVQQRLEELSCGVAFENRARGIGWL